MGDTGRTFGWPWSCNQLGLAPVDEDARSNPPRRGAENRRKINLSTVFAGQDVGVRQVSDRIWLVSFMDYDLGYFDDEECRLEPIANPFSPKVLPMSSE